MMRRRRRILVRTQQKKRKIWNWGVSGKTGWDWLQLLIVPLVLATLGFWFTAQQNRTNNQIALDQQQEATLNAYLDHMSTLLLDNNLRESKQGDEVRNVARIDTLTALRRLDPVRKGVLLQFLYDSGLIVLQSDYLNSVIIDLSGADLSGVIMPSEVTANRSIIIANAMCK